MSLYNCLSLLNSILVFVFGLLLTFFVSDSWNTKREKSAFCILCFALLLLQCVVMFVWDTMTVQLFYPLLVHLPLFGLLLWLKKKPDVALTAIFTAYLCCQLPRWPMLLAESLFSSPLAGEICYTLFIIPIFFVLYRWFVRPARDAMSYSRQSLVLFGSLPFAYYVFDYSTTVYSDALYRGTPALSELFPTALIAFYIIFLTAYHAQSQKRSSAELQSSMLEAQLKKSAREMDALRQNQTQSAIYRHDMRHHLNVIDGFLAADKPRQAREYIENVRSGAEDISLRHFCENEIIDLLCSSFASRADKLSAGFRVNATLPAKLFLSDPELCSLISNGLDNAFCALENSETDGKWVDFYCGIKHSKLLIEIRNPYSGKITMSDGLPVSPREGHGYGCRSIQAITNRHRGLCSFDGENGIFTLRIAIPVPKI